MLYIICDGFHAVRMELQTRARLWVGDLEMTQTRIIWRSRSLRRSRGRGPPGIVISFSFIVTLMQRYRHQALSIGYDNNCNNFLKICLFHLISLIFSFYQRCLVISFIVNVIQNRYFFFIHLQLITDVYSVCQIEYLLCKRWNIDDCY